MEAVTTPTEAAAGSTLEAFTGTIEPTQVSALYKAGLVVVALLMVLLPAVYVGLVGAAGWFVYDHAVSHAKWMTERGGWFIYLGPLVVGGVLVVFMIKPLFARPPKRPEPFSLDPAAEPLLFAFIERICAQVRAPRPRRVDLDCEINASASFRRGLLSVLGDDLVLTIGLPLVAGMSQRQLAGVLAHEFGHFAQGGGMRLTYIIRTVNGWFARVVYERDAWDMYLAEFSRKIDVRVGIILYAARACVWCTRKILWALMMVGHLFSCFMLRQMEFDADTYEAKLAGSDTFAATAKRLQELGLAGQIAWHHLRQSYQTQRLPDNLPLFIARKTAEIPADVRTALDKAQAESKTGWFDTHPCDTERVQRALALAQPGVFRREAPATELFQDFSAVARQATIHRYRLLLEDEFKPELLVSTDETLAESSAIQHGSEAADRLWHGLFSPARPLVIAPHEILPLPDPRASLKTLQQRRAEMLAQAEEFKQAAKAYTEAVGRKQLAQTVRDLQAASFKVDPKVYALPGKSPAESLACQLVEADPQQPAAQRAAACEAVARERLLAALQLLNDASLASEARAAGLAEEARELVKLLGPLGQVMPAVTELGRTAQALDSLFEGRKSEEAAKTIDPVIERLVSHARAQITAMDQRLAGLRYPFKHARGQIGVVDFARHPQPHQNPWVAAYQECSGRAERLNQLYWRVIGRLAAIAETVEQEVLGAA